MRCVVHGVKAQRWLSRGYFHRVVLQPNHPRSHKVAIYMFALVIHASHELLLVVVHA